jgi:hypothetical protein
LLELDHLVVAASTLERGVNWLEHKLGVKLQAGGKHPLFGTHNALLKLGASTYLEVISIDPDAPAPTRARWFELDKAHLLEQPKLIHWVASTENPEARVLEFPFLGRVLEASRGDLRWQITVPDDGHLNFLGLIPTLISWNGIHPTTQLEHKNCELLQLEGYHPESNDVNIALEQLGAKSLLEVSSAPTPRLKAVIQTPNGRVEL